MKKKIRAIIQQLQLQAHPEGGYFVEQYRSSMQIPHEALPSSYDGARSYATAIYFLLTTESFSAFHKIHQDEIWHFYSGSSLTLHTISPTGHHTIHIIGNQLEKGERPMVVVPGGHYFAAEIASADSYALVGCTVAPGFDFADFELPKREGLISLFPRLSSLITRLTRA